MNVALLGANCLLCSEVISQAVVPPTGLPSSSTQLNDAPPQSWTSIPKCRLYQACSALGSFALKKIPPIPVTRFIDTPRQMPSNIVEFAHARAGAAEDLLGVDDFRLSIAAEIRVMMSPTGSGSMIV